jgi:hypothetical protein
MPKQLTLRGPVQTRAFVSDAYGTDGYDPKAELIDRVIVHERGPDIELQVYARDVRAGSLTVRREDERELLARLFGETRQPAPGLFPMDREILGRQIDAHEEACMAGDTLKVTQTRRILWTYLTALLTDHAELVRLNEGQRGAA